MKLVAVITAGLVSAMCWFHGRAVCDLALAVFHHWSGGASF